MNYQTAASEGATVYVKGLDSSHVTCETIEGLFSNFGNIQQILYLSKKNAALVQYVEASSASVSKEMLNNLSFFGSQLKVGQSQAASIEEYIGNANRPDLYNEVYYPNPKTYRFKDYKKISINPPSKVLHLSNIARELFNDSNIYQIFEAEGAVVRKVKLL